jgi:ankyrin repeat protein
MGRRLAFAIGGLFVVAGVAAWYSSGLLLHWACERGHETAVAALLMAGTDPNAVVTNNRTALWVATKLGWTRIAKLLLAHGADLRGDAQGVTPLFLAAMTGRDELASAFLERDSSLAFVEAASVDGETPLLMACWSGAEAVARRLIALGADVNHVALSWGHPLFIAADAGHLALVRLLLQHGAVVDAACPNDGGTALLIACQRGHTAIAQELLAAGAKIEQTYGPGGVTPLFVASMLGHVDTVKFLLASGAQVDGALADGRVPLWQAAHNGHVQVVQVLLAAGADPSRREPDSNQTALEIAAARGRDAVVEVLAKVA